MSNNSVPYEIIAAPFTLWVAAVGTSFPLIDAAPSGSWSKVGSFGDQNYTEDGVTISHSEETEKFKSLGGIGVRKVFMTGSELMIGLKLADLTLEAYSLALNGNAVTTVAAGSGTAGYKKIGLSPGLAKTAYALLLRGPSPYGENWNLQYEVPRAMEESAKEVTMRKGTPAALDLKWSALEDPDAASVDERYGVIRAQYAAAL